MASRLSTVLVAVGFGPLALAASGCEYLIELDRGLVDAGGDAGCAICSGTGEDASEPDATAEDVADGANAEAGPLGGEP